MSLKKIAVFGSLDVKSEILINLFKGLKERGCEFYFFKTSRDAGEVKNILLPLLPFFYFYYFFFLFFYKFKEKVKVVVCLDFWKKILVTWPAAILGLKVIWLEEGVNNKKLWWLYKISAPRAKIIVWGEYLKRMLEKRGIRAEKIIRVSPGIKIGQREHQENIFFQMAEANRDNFKKKFFNIGAILDLNKEQKLEILFQAIKICLPVIPNIQLVVVGEGKERKNLMWLAKKMEIDSLVWFVGEQKHIRKWLANFDIFILAKENPEINNVETILYAMDAGLPVIGPINSILEDIVEENKAGSLIEIENSEMLARQIIKLYKDKHLRLMLGQYAQKAVREKFSLERMVEELFVFLCDLK